MSVSSQWYRRQRADAQCRGCDEPAIWSRNIQVDGSDIGTMYFCDQCREDVISMKHSRKYRTGSKLHSEYGMVNARSHDPKSPVHSSQVLKPQKWNARKHK